MNDRSRAAPVLAASGAVAVAVSLVFYATLHLTPPSAQLSWSRRTISHYALLSNGWLFDAATLLLAAGSAAVLLAVRRAGLARAGAAALLLLWVAGLVGVVWFEKHDWAIGPSRSGDIHRVASVVAFLSLPTGALLAAGPHLRTIGARLVAAGGTVSLLCFAPILWAVASEPWTGVRWWRAIPLGGVERALGLAEVATVLLLAWWAARTARRDTDGDRDRRGTDGHPNRRGTDGHPSTAGSGTPTPTTAV